MHLWGCDDRNDWNGSASSIDTEWCDWLVLMALFGLLWLLRIRSDVRKHPADEKCDACGMCQTCDAADVDDGHPMVVDRRYSGSSEHKETKSLLPPPITFADRAFSVDAEIPPPPPPPLLSLSRRSLQSIHVHCTPPIGGHRPMYTTPLSRSVHNIPHESQIQCTCPIARSVRRPCVRFRDDPLGYHSVRGPNAESWNYPSVITTLPRNRSHFKTAQGKAEHSLQLRLRC